MAKSKIVTGSSIWHYFGETSALRAQWLRNPQWKFSTANGRFFDSNDPASSTRTRLLPVLWPFSFRPRDGWDRCHAISPFVENDAEKLDVDSGPPAVIETGERLSSHVSYSNALQHVVSNVVLVTVITKQDHNLLEPFV